MSSATRRILVSVTGIVVIAVVAAAWILRSPDPMAFADGPMVKLADQNQVLGDLGLKL